MHDTDSYKKNIHEDYEIEEELGSGQFAVVRKIVEKETGDEFAAKYVRKKRTKASRNGMSREDIKREIEILRMVDSEKIIKVHDIYETDKEMILVMELLRGGELFDYISKKDFLTEEEAIDFTRQILQALQHLHSRNVVHLDLKPENILLKNTRRKTIKLVDFGLARVVNENEQVREIMGTPEFVAPEVLNFDTISTATDMWALGVIAYILLSGASPFLGEDNQETFTNIIQVDYQFDEEYFAEISDEAKDFIRKLLVKNPRKRPTAHECSRHTWVEEEVVDKKKRQRRRTTQICTFNFKRFVARKRWKMSYNKIRAMNLIAKMGIKPPPGFITEIPPMMGNSESVTPQPEEKPSSHEEHKKHKSSINRKKHKQPSSPKSTVEKSDSLTLKAMEIDIGEGESVEPEPEPADEDEVKVEPTPKPEEPVDYGSMSKREKRRARGQLRTDEIAKSKKVIDEKEAQREIEVMEQAVNGGETANDEPAMEVDVSAPAVEMPAEPKTVTSTMQIDHKPAAKTQSAGILRKRDAKPSRIPSTEDHYFVTLNAALLQQEETFHYSGLQPTRQHGILKNSVSAPNTSEMVTNVFDEQASSHVAVPKASEVGAKNSEVPKSSESKNVVSQFTTVVEVLSGGNAPATDEYPGTTGGLVVGLQVEKAAAHAPEKETADERKPNADDEPLSTSRQNSETKITPQAKMVTTPVIKKPLTRTDNPPGPRAFSPPPWQKKANTENSKPTPKPIHGVSKVSLKANRFLSNDKQPHVKSPTSTTPGPMKATNVLGKSKLFQKEQNKAETKKTEVVKTNSVGQELKDVACDINLDDTPSKNDEQASVEVSTSKPRAGSQSKVRSNSQSKPSDSQSKPRSDSQSKPRSSSVKGNNNTNNVKNNNIENNSNKKKVSSNGHAVQSSVANRTEEKVLNGEEKHAAIETSGANEGAETGTEDLTSSSSHSLTEFTIRPRQNSGEKKAGGFDVMLTIAPPSDQPAQEPRAVSTMKTRFTSSSSSLPDPRSGVPNGKLTSLSTSDVTSAASDRHGVAQGSKYTPQRNNFSKYLGGDQPNPGKITVVPAKPSTVNWQPKRNTPPAGTVAPPKTTVNPPKTTANPPKTTANPPKTSATPPKTTVTPKSPTPPTTRAPSATAKTAAAKVSGTVAVPKGKKTAVTSTAYIPRRSFGFAPKTSTQSETVVKESDTVVKPSETEDAPKMNNNDASKRWSQSSYTSDRSASSASSDELSLSNVTAENNALNRSNAGSNEQIKNPEISRKIENHSEHGKLSPRASPVLERKWKATLVLPKESEKVPSTKDRDIRIASTNAPHKKKFSNVRSMWEGK